MASSFQIGQRRVTEQIFHGWQGNFIELRENEYLDDEQVLPIFQLVRNSIKQGRLSHPYLTIIAKYTYELK